jgi:formylglycine-generating enzyme required for sulfatase activity
VIHDCTFHIVRGDSWADGPHDLRSASRFSSAFGTRVSTLGSEWRGRLP